MQSRWVGPWISAAVGLSLSSPAALVADEGSTARRFEEARLEWALVEFER